VVSIASVSDAFPTVDASIPNPELELDHDHAIDLPLQTTASIDFFDPLSWQIDDIPLDVVALVSSMGNQSTEGSVANSLSEGSWDPELCMWNTDYGVDLGVSNV
jgi:hypothetical protein